MNKNDALPPRSLTGELMAFDGTRLFTRTYKPTEPARAVILGMHGLAEHSGRYEHVAEFLTDAGFVFETFDLRGHGHSDGARAFVKSFDVYLHDFDIVLSEVARRHPNLPVFLFGHSLGGTIVVLYTIIHQPEIAGLVLSAPELKISESISPVLIKLAPLIGKLFPKLPTVVLDKNAISSDPAVVRQYDEDPLNCRRGIPARTGAELNRGIKDIESQMEKLTLPFIIMHGTSDNLADIRGSQKLFEQTRSADKTFKSYDGFYHEILNEPEKLRVLTDLREWLISHSG